MVSAVEQALERSDDGVVSNYSINSEYIKENIGDMLQSLTNAESGHLAGWRMACSSVYK